MRTIGTMAAVAVALALATTATAEDKKAGKPQGTWVRDLGGDNKITLTFKGDTMTGIIAAGGGNIEFDASIGQTKAGRIFGIITKTKKSGDGGPSEGDLF